MVGIYGRRTRKRRASALSVAYKAKRARTKVAQMQRGYLRTGGFYGRFAGPGAELKWLDTTIGLITAQNTGNRTSNSLVEVSQGTGESQRIGRKITVKSIHLKGYVLLPGGKENTVLNDFGWEGAYDRIRVIVYLDKQTNGTSATIGSVIEGSTLVGFRNLSNTQRYNILYDRTTSLSASNAAHEVGSLSNETAWGPQCKSLSWNKQCNIPIEYSDVNGTLSELRSNNIGVMVISNGGYAQVHYKCRIRYSDK